MKPGYTTSEFWISIVVTLLSLAGSFGYLTPEEIDGIAQNITQIVGGVIALWTTIRYIKSRENLKVAGIQAETTQVAAQLAAAAPTGKNK